MRNWIRAAYLKFLALALRPFYIAEETAPDVGSIRKILVLRFDRIGDMVQATPLLEGLREEFPGANICVLASEQNAPVLDSNPHVDRVFILPASAQSEFIKGLNKEHFDLIINAHLSYDWTWYRLAWQIKGRYGLCLDLNGQGLTYSIRVPAPLPELSAAEALLEICRRGLQRPFQYHEPRVYISDDEVQASKAALAKGGLDLSKPLVFLHPGAHRAERRWPVENFAQLAGILQKEGYTTILIGGPQDEALLAHVESFQPKPTVWRLADLKQLMGWIACARLLICNNSGPMHLAAALGVPTLSTLKPAEDRNLWWPQGKFQVVVERDPLSALRVEEMAEKALAFLNRLEGNAATRRK
jgi:ADP-heptose:LPS heptosyltransferase